MTALGRCTIYQPPPPTPGTAWIAQLVEHQTFNLRIQGSSPCSGSMVPFVGFPDSSDVKNLPAMLDTWVWLLGWEDLLEKGWLPTPVFLPGKFHEEMSLVTGLQSKGLVALLCPILCDPMDCGSPDSAVPRAAVYRTSKSQTWLSDQHFHFHGTAARPQMHCSVQFSRLVVSDSLQPYGLQHARLPCP